MRIEDLLQRFDGVRQVGPGRWVALCPAHDDRSPSLSIKLAEDGRTILLHDFAGCRPEEITARVGVPMSELFNDPPGAQRKGCAAEAPPDIVRELGPLRLRVAGCRLGPLGARLAVVADLEGLQLLRDEVEGWSDKDLSRFAGRLLGTFGENPAPVTEPGIVGALRGLADEAKARGAADGNGHGGKRGPRPEGDLQGQALLLSDPEPWEEPVDGAGLLEEIAGTFRRFVVLPAGGAEAAALWTLHTYALDAATVSPLLTLTSPEKRCGKTRVLEVASALVRRPVFASNLSPAALFRGVEKYRPTLLADEFDALTEGHEELRGILNAGHTRSTAWVIRTVGDNFEPRAFSTWCPKMVALIGKLPPTLEDRSILVPMRRRAREERVERLRLDRVAGELEPLRRQAARWAADQLEVLRAAEPDVPETLHDRACDNWRPLLAIADAAGGEWPKRAQRAALALSGAVDLEEEGAGVLLLGDLRDLFTTERVGRLTTGTIIEGLIALEERPWAEWKKGRPITPEKVARLLKPFGVRPGRWRDGMVTCRGYLLKDLADPFLRYLPPFQGDQPNTPDTTQQNQDVMGESDSAHPPGCAESKSGVSHQKQRDVPGVPSSDPGEGGSGEKERAADAPFDPTAWGLPEEREVPFEVEAVPPDYDEPGATG